MTHEPGWKSASVWVFVGYDETIYQLTSYDDQTTWSSPVSTLTNARFPQCVSGSPSLIVGMRGDSEDEPGVLVGKTMELGESSWSTEFTLESGGSDIRVENEPFALCSEANGHSLVLAAIKEGETAITRWRSWDGGHTWEEIVKGLIDSRVLFHLDQHVWVELVVAVCSIRVPIALDCPAGESATNSHLWTS